MTRVCLYLRISTDEDHQPTSLKTQRERLERFCEAMDDWRIVAAFEDQASGTNLDRPGLQPALALAREKRVDLLLGALSPLRPRLRRHLGTRTHRPVHLLRLLHPLQVPATSTAPRSATATGFRRTAWRPPSSRSSPASSATDASSRKRSPRSQNTSRANGRGSKSNSPQPAQRSLASRRSSSATSRPSKKAASHRLTARTACVATVPASKRSATKKPTSPTALAHRHTRRPTRPPSPAWPTNSTRSSATRVPSRPRNSSA